MMAYNVTQLDTFLSCYKRNLEKAVREYPAKYWWPIQQLDLVYGRTRHAVKTRGIQSVDKNGLAWKWTCKELGIKHTYKAMIEYLREGMGPTL